MKKRLLLGSFMWIGGSFLLQAQPLIFEDSARVQRLQRAMDHIYNLRLAEARTAVDSMRHLWPAHPIVPILDALCIYWERPPMYDKDPQHEMFMKNLEIGAQRANQMRKKRQASIDGLLFELFSRGLLVEHYAETGQYLAALGESKALYDLLLEADTRRKENMDLYFIVGLYNYFRERYPEVHPVYRPFVWIFRRGNKELGKAQLDSVSRMGIISRAEAKLYLSYIYLRWENQPQKSIAYLHSLHEEYPDNLLYVSKLVEAYVRVDAHDKVEAYMDRLILSADWYFRLAGHFFKALLEENKNKDFYRAESHYRLALHHAKDVQFRGSFYKASSYLGLGRMLERKKQYENAKKNYKQAMESTNSSRIKKEAKRRMKNLPL